MNLKEKIEADIKSAMLSKDKDALRALRAIKSLILLEETKESGSGNLSADDEMKILTKASKQRKDSLDIYHKQGREDLASAEQAELDIIARYLPAQLDAEALRKEVMSIVHQVGAKGPADMGKVMGAATKAFAGRADGRDVSNAVKEILAGLNS
jgi:uncharacterized protein YqeY